MRISLRSLRTVFIAMAGLFLMTSSGCSKYHMSSKFDEKSVSTLLSSDAPKATVTGQAFMKTRGGDVKYGAGNQVSMTPFSDHGLEFVRNRTMNDYPKIVGLHPRFFEYVKTTRADGEGNFAFRDVPEGEYLFFTTIKWTYYNGQFDLPAGGTPWARIVVTKDTPKVILTR